MNGETKVAAEETNGDVKEVVKEAVKEVEDVKEDVKEEVSFKIIDSYVTPLLPLTSCLQAHVWRVIV